MTVRISMELADLLELPKPEPVEGESQANQKYMVLAGNYIAPAGMERAGLTKSGDYPTAAPQQQPQAPTGYGERRVTGVEAEMTRRAQELKATNPEKDPRRQRATTPVKGSGFGKVEF